VEHYTYEEHEQLRTAAVECICNLVQNEDVTDLYDVSVVQNEDVTDLYDVSVVQNEDVYHISYVVLELKSIVLAIQWALVCTYWIDELLDLENTSTCHNYNLTKKSSLKNMQTV